MCVISVRRGNLYHSKKPRTRIAALKKHMAKEAAQHRENAPKARAALLEAIDQQLGFVLALEIWWIVEA